MESYHEVDPDGDLVLILRADHGTSLASTKSTEDNPSNSDTTETAVSESSCEDENVPCTPSTSNTECEEIRIRVSSKHLALASRVFKAMLQPGFQVGDELRANGHATLPLPDDNPTALLHLLRLAHCKIRDVPREVDLELLMELAILVDKYALSEITDMFADLWIDSLKWSIPNTFDENLLPWIWISRAFGKADTFKEVTKVAQLESIGFIEEDRLPIPNEVPGMKQALLLSEEKLNLLSAN